LFGAENPQIISRIQLVNRRTRWSIENRLLTRGGTDFAIDEGESIFDKQGVRN